MEIAHKDENLAHEQRHWDMREPDEYIIAQECSRSYILTPEQIVCRKETLAEIMAEKATRKAKYLNELKASGGCITPKKWTADKSRLTAQKNVLYEKMKSMREELKTVETLRKNAEQLAKTETPPRKNEQER